MRLRGNSVAWRVAGSRARLTPDPRGETEFPRGLSFPNPLFGNEGQGRAAAREALGQVEEARKDSDAALRIEDEGTSAGSTP